MENKVWFCKVGFASEDELPSGSDFPMRKAVDVAFQELIGRFPEFIFSGWGGQLTESELAVVENRDPATATPSDTSADRGE